MIKFREINATTQKAQGWTQARKLGYRLDDVYTSYSNAKYNAWSDCLDLYREMQGSNFSIISFNTFQFTVRFEVEDATIVITRDNNYKLI